MIEMAEIFRLHKEEYLGKYGDRILPSHRRAIDDIIACRTPALGGSFYTCGKTERYSYHSCGNRHCPKCGNDNVTLWVAKQVNLIPAVPCFLFGFTLPHELNKTIRSNQKDCYSLLFRASSESIKKLAADPRLLGAQPGMLGVLHTWGRNMSNPPHIHYVVPGGGIDKNGKWKFTPYKQKFFLPAKAISPIFRAKFRDGMKALGLYDEVPKVVWKTMKLPVLSFMARFLQHVLPKSFCKVRYYGFLHQRCREKLKSIKQQLKLPEVIIPVLEPEKHFCPHCGEELVLVRILQPQREPP